MFQACFENNTVVTTILTQLPFLLDILNIPISLISFQFFSQMVCNPRLRLVAQLL